MSNVSDIDVITEYNDMFSKLYYESVEAYDFIQDNGGDILRRNNAHSEILTISTHLETCLYILNQIEDGTLAQQIQELRAELNESMKTIV